MMKSSTSLHRLSTIIKKSFRKKEKLLSGAERRARKQAQALYQSYSQEGLGKEEAHPLDLLPLRRINSFNILPKSTQLANKGHDENICPYEGSSQNEDESFISIVTPLESPLSPVMQQMVDQVQKNELPQDEEITNLAEIFDEFVPYSPPNKSGESNEEASILEHEHEAEEECISALNERLEALKDLSVESNDSKDAEENLEEVRFNAIPLIDTAMGSSFDDENDLRLFDAPGPSTLSPIEELQTVDFSQSQMLESPSASVDNFKNPTEYQNRSAMTLLRPSDLVPALRYNCPELACPEFVDLAETSQNITDRSLPRELLLALDANFRSCMAHSDTRLRETLTELVDLTRSLINKNIDISSRNGDPRSLFLVPINETSLPKWLSPATRVKIGRNCPWLQFKSLVVSRNHCELFHDIDTFYIVDSGSSSGTFVNGHRLATSGTRSNPRAIESGDIIQLGIDYTCEANEYGVIEGRFAGVQMLALLGYKCRATVPTKDETLDVTDLQGPRKQVTRLLSWKKIMKIAGRLHSIIPRLELSNVRIWIDGGDLFHSNSSGLAVVFYKDRPAFTAIYNNFKLSWEIAMTDSEGESVLILDILPGSFSVFTIMKGLDNLARLTSITKDRTMIDPIQQQEFQSSDTNEISIGEEKAFYSLLTDVENGKMFITRRFHGSRRQDFLGEALLRKVPKRGLFDSRKRLLECRVALPLAHERLVVLGLLFACLKLIET